MNLFKPIVLLGLVLSIIPISFSMAERTKSGLQAFYNFSAGKGIMVKDRAGVGKATDLKITNPKAVKWMKDALQVHGTTLIQSDKPATRLMDAIRKTGEITVEAWLHPAKTDLTGPARIVTLSKNTSERNFTLGQDTDKYDFRLRTPKTGKNGIPSLASKNKTLGTKRTHVVYTRNRAGKARLFLNGKQNAEKTVQGDFSNWDRSHHLALANELTNDRAWQGTFYLVAIYNRNLSPSEVMGNFKAGPHAGTGSSGADLALHFETQVAPLLANHCLECHDAATKKGGLDLSRKESAFKGGEDGLAIVPGKITEGLLWKSVQSDEMPKKRPPLSQKEKLILKDWITKGATWTAHRIDPAVYVQKDRAAELWIQRLTVEEYIETVRSAVDVDIADEARKILPRDQRADGFNNTAYNLNIDFKHVEAYAKLAEIVVRKMDVEAYAKKFAKSKRLIDKDMRDLIAKMGKWVLRGPLETYEVDIYRGISTTVATAGGNFKEAVGYIITAMLQSPRFIYRMENQQGDGTAWPVDDYTLASRMSYIIWGAPPDKVLYQAAESGELSDPVKLESQIQRMFQDERAAKRASRFLYEWLNLERLSNLQPNPKRFPDWNKQLAEDMRQESLAYFFDVVWKQKRPLSALLNTQVAYLTPALAKHYGIEPTAKKRTRYDLSSIPARGGLLTQGSVLTIGGDEASMVTRGLFVLNDMLRGVVKDPPPGLDTTPIPSKPGLSHRGVSEMRVADKSCGGCHEKFEPLAFGLEKFDGLGAYHEKDEHGNNLREDGEILFPGEAKAIPYRTSSELMDILAESDRVSETLTWKITQFALGRPLVAADRRSLEKIHRASQKGGGTYFSLITSIIQSDLVQMARTEANE